MTPSFPIIYAILLYANSPFLWQVVSIKCRWTRILTLFGPNLILH